MREINRMIAKYEILVDEMEQVVREENSCPMFSAFRGPEAERRARDEQLAESRFRRIETEARAVAREAFRWLKSEGIDSKSSEMDEIESRIKANASKNQIIEYCRVTLATLRAKSLLLST